MKKKVNVLAKIYVDLRRVGCEMCLTMRDGDGVGLEKSSLSNPV